MAALPKGRNRKWCGTSALPGMNGVECVRQLKPLLPNTQVMMLTVWDRKH